jgi:hypothetical protein
MANRESGGPDQKKKPVTARPKPSTASPRSKAVASKRRVRSQLTKEQEANTRAIKPVGGGQRTAAGSRGNGPSLENVPRRASQVRFRPDAVLDPSQMRDIRSQTARKGGKPRALGGPLPKTQRNRAQDAYQGSGVHRSDDYDSPQPGFPPKLPTPPKRGAR